MIKLTQVTKIYDQRTVLDQISLAFESGKTHVLLGSSGCGKSTLLRLIMGLTPLSAGTIEIDGLSMQASTQQELVRRIGYVIQDGGLFPHLTVIKNVTLSASTFGWSKEKIRHRLDDLISLVNLEISLLEKYPQELSGGQNQRVALVRALFLEPATILLDEPLGAVDPVVRSSLQGQLKTIFNRLKKTVIWVTHDISEAAFFGHTVTLMNAGRVVQHGTFEDLVRQPKDPFVTEFLMAQRPAAELRELW